MVDWSERLRLTLSLARPQSSLCCPPPDSKSGNILENVGHDPWAFGETARSAKMKGITWLMGCGAENQAPRQGIEYR